MKSKRDMRNISMLLLLPALILAGCSVAPAAVPQGDDAAFQFKLLDSPTSEAVAMAPTATPEPTATDTPEPTATNTSEPTATDTPEPTATDTPEPTATDTPEPTATDTPEPTATDTPEPTATDTPEPTATDTPEPTATDTPEPTETPVPTVTPTPEPTDTPEPAAQPDADANSTENASNSDDSSTTSLTVGQLLNQDAPAETEDNEAEEDSAAADEATEEQPVLRLGDLLNQSDDAQGEAGSSTADAQPADDGRTFVAINTSGRRLNVRRGPGGNFGALSALDAETVVEIVAVSDDGEWGQISTEEFGSGGWISLSFTEPVEAPANAGPAPEASQDEATNDANDEVADDEVAADEVTETTTITATRTYTSPVAITQPENINIRSGPGTAFDVVTVAPSGTEYAILGLSPDGEWYQVQLPDQDEPGWVYAPLTETVGPAEEIPTLDESVIPEAPEAPVAVAGPSVAPAPAGSGFFGYGLQAHMLGGGIDEATNATQAIGFNWLKQQVEWRIFEGSPGAIDFSELRRIVDSAGARGISVLFSVVNAPDWARESGFDASVGGPPADPQSYANFVGRLAGEFCGSPMQAIEVWNEQNLHYEWGNKPLNPSEYMNLLRSAYSSIKGACPSMLVISGALTPTGPNGNFAMDDFAYLEAMYQNGLAGVSDGIGAHPSGYNVPPSVRHEEACAVIQQTGNFFNGACDNPHHSWSFRSSMEGYRNIMLVYGDANKRLWPTEFGWAAGGAYDPRYAYANDNSYEEQAAWTVEAFTMMRDWGWVGPAFLWNLNFRVVADGTEKAQWGIVRNDYSPLPVYDALRNMPK